MKTFTNLFCAAVLLTIFTGCAQPVLEKNFAPPPPVSEYDYEAEHKRIAEERRKEAELARQEAERVAHQQELERLAQEAERRAREERERKQAAKEHQRIDVIKQTRNSIDDFKSLIENGKCSAAERDARQLMDMVRSNDNRLESDLLTATCLCYLEVDGDVTRFNRCSAELQKLTANHRYLERETQLVLSLHPYFKERAAAKQRDPRIELKLEQDVKNLLGTTTN